MSVCRDKGCSLEFGHQMPHVEKRLVRDSSGVWWKYRAWGEWRDYLGQPEVEP